MLLKINSSEISFLFIYIMIDQNWKEEDPL